MQNKANLLDTRMNVSIVLTKDYENERLCRLRQNKAKTNPIKPKSNPISRKAKINVTLVKTRNYNNEQRTMNYELLFKTNPNQTQIVAAETS